MDQAEYIKTIYDIFKEGFKPPIADETPRAELGRRFDHRGNYSPITGCRCLPCFTAYIAK
jgi:hypothetical protein